jgi:hypothetical protein
MANTDIALTTKKSDDRQPERIYRYLVCITAHLTEQDDELLYCLCHDKREWGDAEWVYFTGTGYVVRLSAFNYPLLILKRRGLSKSARWFVHVMMTRFDVALIHFDCDGEVLSGFDVHGW